MKIIYVNIIFLETVLTFRCEDRQNMIKYNSGPIPKYPNIEWCLHIQNQVVKLVATLLSIFKEFVSHNFVRDLQIIIVHWSVLFMFISCSLGVCADSNHWLFAPRFAEGLKATKNFLCSTSWIRDRVHHWTQIVYTYVDHLIYLE